MTRPSLVDQGCRQGLDGTGCGKSARRERTRRFQVKESRTSARLSPTALVTLSVPRTVTCAGGIGGAGGTGGQAVHGQHGQAGRAGQVFDSIVAPPQ